MTMTGVLEPETVELDQEKKEEQIRKFHKWFEENFGGDDDASSATVTR